MKNQQLSFGTVFPEGVLVETRSLTVQNRLSCEESKLWCSSLKMHVFYRGDFLQSGDALLIDSSSNRGSHTPLAS